MKRQLIVQISEGLGNQLFMFANAYAISRENNLDLFIDNKTGYLKKKNLLRPHQYYLLHRFNLYNFQISNDILSKNFFSIYLKKILTLIERFKKNKLFYREKIYKINNKKIINTLATFQPSLYGKKIYIQGNFENEDYFVKYKKEINHLFNPNIKITDELKNYIDKLYNNNSVSLHLRRNRFSDQYNLSNNTDMVKSNNFTLDIINYINRATQYIEDHLSKPKYFIWTNDVKNINFFTSKLKIKKFEIVNTNDPINDFKLFRYSKNFIVGPSSYHWWGAWLNDNQNKICLRPKNINPSNNVNFWPKDWISI